MSEVKDVPFYDEQGKVSGVTRYVNGRRKYSIIGKTEVERRNIKNFSFNINDVRESSPMSDNINRNVSHPPLPAKKKVNNPWVKEVMPF